MLKHLLFVLVSLLTLVGCAKVPECNDPATEKLVSQVYWDNLRKAITQLEGQAPFLRPYLAFKSVESAFPLTITQVVQQKLDNGKLGYQCKANLTVTTGTVVPETAGDSERSTELQHRPRTAAMLITSMLGTSDFPSDPSQIQNWTQAILIPPDIRSFVVDFSLHQNGEGLLPEDAQTLEQAENNPNSIEGLVTEGRTILQLWEGVNGEGLVNGQLAHSISYLSTTRKVDGEGRHYVELSPPSPSINHDVYAYAIRRLYLSGKQKLNVVAQYARTTLTKYNGLWTGIYQCEGFGDEGKGSGPGADDQKVFMELEPQKEGSWIYNAKLDHITPEKGVEKLRGTFDMVKLDNLKLSGVGEDSADVKWETNFALDFSDGALSGEGARAFDGRAGDCKLKLTKENRK